MILRQRVELERDFFKSELLKMNYKPSDGRQLCDLTWTELNQIYTDLKRRAKDEN